MSPVDDRFDDDVHDDMFDDMFDDDMHDVRLLGVPVALHLLAQEHRAEIAREMYLIGHPAAEIHLVAGADPGRADPAHAMPLRLTRSIDVLTNQLSVLTAEQDLALAQAMAAERDTIDLTYRFPGSAAEAAVALIKALDEADDFCLRGDQLLALVAAPDLVRYRHWYFGEFASQIAGNSPVPWSTGD